ncbi:MAG: hypothetical protein ACXW3K_04225 [Brevundimonas sp.]
MITFPGKRGPAILFSFNALLFGVMLYREWRSHDAEQARLLTQYPKLAQHFSVAELERMAPSADSLVMLGVVTGIMISAALMLWRRDER